MPLIKLNDATYHYQIQGNGPALLLLHGFTGSSANWSEQIGCLMNYFQVICIDLLGHGRSDKPSDPARYAMPLVVQVHH